MFSVWLELELTHFSSHIPGLFRACLRAIRNCRNDVPFLVYISDVMHVLVEELNQALAPLRRVQASRTLWSKDAAHTEDLSPKWALESLEELKHSLAVVHLSTAVLNHASHPTLAPMLSCLKVSVETLSHA